MMIIMEGKTEHSVGTPDTGEGYKRQNVEEDRLLEAYRIDSYLEAVVERADGEFTRNYILDDCDFELAEEALAASANRLADRFLTAFDDTNREKHFLAALGLFDRFKLEQGTTDRLAQAITQNTGCDYTKFLASPKFRDELPEAYAQVLERARTELENNPLYCIELLQSIGPITGTPEVFELIKQALQQPIALEYFGRNLIRFSAEIPQFDELCARYDIDTSKLDLIPEATIAFDNDALTAQSAQIAGFINRLQWGKLKEGETAQTFGVSEQSAILLEQIPQLIATELQELAERVKTIVPPEDYQLLVEKDSNKSGVPPMQRTVEAMTARYIALQSGGTVPGLNRMLESQGQMYEIRRFLRTLSNAYTRVYTTHTPYYDDVYDHFDKLRQIKGSLEVYLGGDGVYAYLGRKAQRAARQKANPKEEGLQLKYLVFSRKINASASESTQRQYLDQEGITGRADLLIYDTGFSATIPTRILTLMGMSQEIINRSIKLLSAENPNYQIPLRSKTGVLVHSEIEDAKKGTQAAQGLALDAKGALYPVAAHTSPAEQLQFSMLQRTLLQHYFVRERARLAQAARAQA